MKDEADVMCLCSLDKYLAILSKKWTLLILNEIVNHKKLRYSELLKEINGISPSILASSLKKLEELDLIKKQIYNEIPLKVIYSPSQQGKEFRQGLEPLINWSSRRDDFVIHCSCSLIYPH